MKYLCVGAGAFHLESTKHKLLPRHLPIVGAGAGRHGLPVHVDAIRAVARKVLTKQG